MSNIVGNINLEFYPELVSGSIPLLRRSDITGVFKRHTGKMFEETPPFKAVRRFEGAKDVALAEGYLTAEFKNTNHLETQNYGG